MQLNEKDLYKFDLSFKGHLVENSVDAFDLANTILAVSQALNQISSIKYESLEGKVKINVNAFSRGSFLSEFLVYVDTGKDLLPAFIPVAVTGYQVGKELLGSLKTYLEVKKMLKGKPPTKIEHKGNGVHIYGGDNHKIVINHYDFRALQDRTVSKNIDKAVQPLLKNDSEIDQISFNRSGEKVASIDRESAPYLKDNEGFQKLDDFKLKGYVTKIDTKTMAGYLNVGDSKAGRRVSFSYGKDLSKERFELLIDSLRTKVKIFLIGRVEMDYEGNPRDIVVLDVKQDKDLFR